MPTAAQDALETTVEAAADGLARVVLCGRLDAQTAATGGTQLLGPRMSVGPESNGFRNLDVQYPRPSHVKDYVFVTLHTPIPYRQSINRAHLMLNRL